MSSVANNANASECPRNHSWRTKAQHLVQKAFWVWFCVRALAPDVSCSGADAQKFVEPRWKLDTIRFRSTPAIGSDGTIYLGTFLQKFWAVSSNGVAKWTFPTGSEIVSSPALAPDGTIYFGCRDRKFYALTPEGNLKWAFTTGAWVDSSPALALDGTVYFGSWDHHLYALNPQGELKWKFETGAEILSSPVVTADGTVLCGSDDGKFYAVAPDGTKRWEYATGGAIVSSPALSGDGTVYFTSLDGGLYALDMNGKLKWRLQTGGATKSSPVIGPEGRIYVGVNYYLWAITPDGKKAWEQRVVHYMDAPPLVTADGIYVVSWEGDLTEIGFDGEIKWVGMLHNNYGGAAPVPSADGTAVYVMGNYGALYNVSRPVELARSPWPCWRGGRLNTGRADGIESAQ